MIPYKFRCELWYQYRGWRFHKMRRVAEGWRSPKKTVSGCPSKKKIEGFF